MKFLPSWKNALLALLAAVMLILAFPDFEWWFLAWFALVPLMWAVERETSLQRPARSKGIRGALESPIASSFLLGWLFGTAFFFGTCWWLTYAPIHYAAMPWPLAYLLIFVVCLVSGIFPGIFAAILALSLRRFGSWAFLAAPFVWVFTEFLRYWLTGNNWNGIGYSQAFDWMLIQFVANITAPVGGVLMTSGFVVLGNGVASWWLLAKVLRENSVELAVKRLFKGLGVTFGGIVALTLLIGVVRLIIYGPFSGFPVVPQRLVVAVQPNVPMSGLDQDELRKQRQRQIEMAEKEIKLTVEKYKKESPLSPLSIVTILPESPMNFMYNDDREFQQFIGDFARRNNVSVLFNSAEPDATNGKYFNSAVMVGPDGREAAQYDKIYLLPFGEAVPQPLEGIVPAFVGTFSYGREYDLLPVGDAKAGVMICFESHFGQLSREYVLGGADVIIEMTNDGYLGPTPVLRQHLANAVFRAVETNRPVLRVTNVGITAYIDERGQVHDPLPSYTEGTRVWTVSKSDGSQTFYVKYGDWFAWVCALVTFGLMVAAFFRRGKTIDERAD